MLDRDKTISLQEATDLLGLSYGTIRVYICKGILKPEKPIGRRPYFTAEYIEKVRKEGFEKPR